MMLAAEAADLDIFAMVKGRPANSSEHRGITHTFVAVPFIAGAGGGRDLAGGHALAKVPAGAEMAAAPLRRWGLLYLLACLAALSHLLLDFTNSYGLRPFYPFSRHWYAWDIVFIFEPLMLAVLLAALVLPWLFGLVNQEIGGRQSGPRGRAASIAALLFIVALWGVRDFEHRRALAAMDSVEFNGEPSIRTAAFPYMVNPFRWAGVAETSDAYVSMEVDSLRPEVDPGNRARNLLQTADPRRRRRRRRRAAWDARIWSGRDFRWWRPKSWASPTPGYLVHFSDVRFFYPEGHPESHSETDPALRRGRLVAYVLLDSELRTIREGFGSPTGPGWRASVTRPG